MLDTFYSNIKQAYRCKQLSPLKNSDHNMISMMPVYCPKLEKSKPTGISKTTIIDETTISALNGCSDLTDWNMYIDDANGDLNTSIDIVTSCI